MRSNLSRRRYSFLHAAKVFVMSKRACRLRNAWTPMAWMVDGGGDAIPEGERWSCCCCCLAATDDGENKAGDEVAAETAIEAAVGEAAGTAEAKGGSVEENNAETGLTGDAADADAAADEAAVVGIDEAAAGIDCVPKATGGIGEASGVARLLLRASAIARARGGVSSTEAG
jgi:hypothetical protein